MIPQVKSAISQVYPDRILVRGYSLVELVGTYTFGDVVYLLMTGELPHGQEGRLVEAILVSCAEHNINTPSTHAARTVANCGVPLQTAIAAGVSAIGEYHGGAGEACARILQEEVSAHPETSPDALAQDIVEDFRRGKRRIPGFGHRIHDPDPRAVRLLSLADEWGISGPHVALARAIVTALQATTGRSLPMNVDGALAALISDMGIGWRYGKALFIIARTAGLAAHVHEEITTGKPFKFFVPTDADYVGPPERPVPLKDTDAT